MFLIILSVIILAAILYAAITEDNEPVAGCILGLILIMFLLAGAFTSNGKEISSVIVYTNPLIAVNGYYVDPSGNYVTEDNRRGTIDVGLADGIPENSVKVVPILIETKTFFDTNFWYAAVHHTENKFSLAFDGHYPE